jgi:hypothetical protein
MVEQRLAERRTRWFPGTLEPESSRRGGLDGSMRRVEWRLAGEEDQMAPGEGWSGDQLERRTRLLQEKGGVETSWRGGPDGSRRRVEWRPAGEEDQIAPGEGW